MLPDTTENRQPTIEDLDRACENAFRRLRNQTWMASPGARALVAAWLEAEADSLEQRGAESYRTLRGLAKDIAR
jgi:hypothetical protein